VDSAGMRKEGGVEDILAVRGYMDGRDEKSVDGETCRH
jgi:hypothetical protein